MNTLLVILLLLNPGISNQEYFLGMDSLQSMYPEKCRICFRQYVEFIKTVKGVIILEHNFETGTVVFMDTPGRKRKENSSASLISYSQDTESYPTDHFSCHINNGCCQRTKVLWQRLFESLIHLQ